MTELGPVGLSVLAVIVLVWLGLVVVAVRLVVVSRRRSDAAMRAYHEAVRDLDYDRAVDLYGIGRERIARRVGATGETPIEAASAIAEEQRLAYAFAVSEARLRLLARHPELRAILDPDRHHRPRDPDR